MDLPLIHACVCYRCEKCSSIYVHNSVVSCSNNTAAPAPTAPTAAQSNARYSAGGNHVQTNGGKIWYSRMNDDDEDDDDVDVASCKGI